MFSRITPTQAEINGDLVGDNLLDTTTVAMDTAFTLHADQSDVWPWMLQLGKNRAGWYLPRRIEHFIPTHKRAIHHVEPRWQSLRVGDVIDDWGGKSATFQAAIIDAPDAIVYTSTRGKTNLTWAIKLTSSAPGQTRIHFRLRLQGVSYPGVARVLGGFVDRLTIAGLAAGLSERLTKGIE